ncbi:DNA internalization-related competence protein ComEC/Rec2 [Virgibacillus kimchii]
MKGYWHLPAAAAVVCILSVHLGYGILFICFFIWLIWLHVSNRLGKIPIILSLTCYIFFYIHIPSIDLHTAEMNEPAQETINGIISSEADITKKKVEFTLQKENGYKILILYFPPQKDTPDFSHYTELKYGASCIVHGKEEIPDESRNPGEFNYREYLLTRGITKQVIISSLDDLSCEGSAFLHHFYSLRLTLYQYVGENVSAFTAAWLNALVLGNDTGIGEETIDLFQRWSLSHILAISGLHIGIIVSLVYFLLIKLNITTKEKAASIMLLILPVYALLAGGAPSVWRASGMVLLFIMLNKFRLRLSLTDVLSIVFLLFIVFNPYIIYHVGFQLSFAVTFALLLSGKWISSSNYMLFKSMQISFVAQMMILPLLIAYFSYFQPLSILLNVVVVPYFTFFVIPFMFIFLLTSPFSILTNVFDQFFMFVHQYFLDFIEWIDAYLNFPWITGSMPFYFIVAYYAFFFLMMLHLERNNRKKAFMFGVCISLLMLCLLVRPYLSPEGRITMLDIGQGDAIVIELPYRRGVIMIDAGSRFSFEDMEASNTVYKQIIKPYLYSRGIRKIDAVFLSHEDIDHMGSVTYMVKELEIDQILISDYYELDDQTARHWMENNAQIERVSHNEKWKIADQLFLVLAPSGDQGGANENSLVLYTEVGGKSWIFTGDIGKEEEKEIVKSYPNLRADVLKVAHHGSNTSSDPAFIKALDPSYSLIPVGVHNSYGHPSGKVIDRLHETTILRTDQHGAIQFRYKEKEGTFYQFLP